MHTPGKPEYASLEAIKHSLCFWSGLVATDRPDLHNLDTDRDKNTVFEIDTQNEIAMIDEAIQQRNALVEALEKIAGGLISGNDGPSLELPAAEFRHAMWTWSQGIANAALDRAKGK
jgi:hypothetical protein